MAQSALQEGLWAKQLRLTIPWYGWFMKWNRENAGRAVKILLNSRLRELEALRPGLCERAKKLQKGYK